MGKYVKTFLLVIVVVKCIAVRAKIYLFCEITQEIWRRGDESSIFHYSFYSNILTTISKWEQPEC